MRCDSVPGFGRHVSVDFVGRNLTHPRDLGADVGGGVVTICRQHHLEKGTQPGHGASA